MPTRRVVTGHAADGRSVVVSDGAVPNVRTADDIGLVFDEVWNTEGAVAPIAFVEEAEPTDRPLRIAPGGAGTVIRVNEFLPGHPPTPMHRTESVDYGIVLEGEMTLILTDAEVTVRTGDVVVQRGTDHAWANRTARTARMAFILVGGAFEPSLRSVLPSAESGLEDLNE